MIYQFVMHTTDEFLWEVLRDLPDVVSAYCITLGDMRQGGVEFDPPQHLHLIGATGTAQSQEEWLERCLSAVGAAKLLARRLEWMVEDLSLEDV